MYSAQGDLKQQFSTVQSFSVLFCLVLLCFPFVQGVRIIFTIYLVWFNFEISLIQSLAFSVFTAKLSLWIIRTGINTISPTSPGNGGLAASIRTLLPNCLLVAKPQEVLKTMDFKNSSSLQGLGQLLKATMLLQGLQHPKSFPQKTVSRHTCDLHLRASYPEGEPA